MRKAEQAPDGDGAEHAAEVDAHAIGYRRGVLGQAAEREPGRQAGVDRTGDAKAGADVDAVDDGRAQQRIVQTEGAGIRGGIAERRGSSVHGLHDGRHLHEERDGPQASFTRGRARARNKPSGDSSHPYPKDVQRRYPLTSFTSSQACARPAPRSTASAAASAIPFTTPSMRPPGASGTRGALARLRSTVRPRRCRPP